MENTVFWGAAIAGVVLILIRWMLSVGGNRPPGPKGWPIVGYLPYLSPLPHLDLQRLAKQYGDIFSIQMGSRNVIVLNDYDSTKEAFAKDAFMGRPKEIPFEVSQTSIDTNAMFGLPWKEQRRFSLHMLRDLGLGKSKMEDQLQEEIAELLDYFEQKANQPILVQDLLAPSMSNNIGALMFGKRYKYDDPVRQMLNDAVVGQTIGGQQVGWLVFFPSLRKIAQSFGLGKKYHKSYRELYSYTRKEIVEHEKTLKPDNVRDFIDGYLLEMRKKKDDPAFCKEVLEDLVVGFFGAGSETVKLSVEWLVLIAASMPDARRRIHAEIDEVIGRNRLPSAPDQKSMPFTEAFILEANRWRTIVPLNILRYTLTDTEIGGYSIPKHSVVISNLWAIHHDEDYWGKDAEEFRPERFLNDEGEAVKKWDHYIPFSIGKRACPGEPLAKVEVFLYFASILQRFDIKLPVGKKPDFEGTLGVGLKPKPQEVILIKRS